MTTDSASLCDVRLERNVLIPLVDGATLAADLHLPDGPGPYPTLISLYPYRKDDVIGSFTAYTRHWFAQRGYAHLLVDVRGYGGSQGRRAESMDPNAESGDAGQVVEWVSQQEWADGSVGVWGVSYGGLTALAAGVARPPHLRAIAAMYPFWDPYAHFVSPGGIPNMLGIHQWSTIMLAQRLAPPTYRDTTGRWLRVWHERLERLEKEGLDVSHWQMHEEADEYWLARVLPVERIDVPTLLIGGWRDLFPQAVADAYERIDAPKQLLVGPWLHVQPDIAAHEPVDWLSILLRFWERTLRGRGEATEPPVTVFVQGAGGWRGETAWPPREVEWRTLRPASGGVLAEEISDGEDEYEGTALTGATSGQWDAMATGMGYPLDQGPDDLLSLTYTTAPLDAPLELAGSPEVALDVEHIAAADPFDLVAKLVDVAPDGHAELVTSGWRRGKGTIRLWATAWALAPGHRLRLSVSCADFPRAWPDSTMPHLRLRHAGSEVRLPAVRGEIGDAYEPPRPEPVPAAERFPWTGGGPEPSWVIERDVANDTLAVTVRGGETMRLPEGGTLTLRQRATARVAAVHPQGASVEADATIVLSDPDGEQVAVEVHSRATRDRNLYSGKVTINGRPMLERSWRNF